MATAKWTPDFIGRMHEEGDSLADGAVREIFGDGDVDRVNNLLQFLIENDQELPPDLPDHLRSYLDRSDDLPDWIDPELVREGQGAFKEHGFLTFVILGCASLPEDYVLRDGTRVLGRTQDLIEHVDRRIWETAIFLIDTMNPGEGSESGGFDEGGRGIRSAQRVRLMHAAVRHLLLTDKETIGIKASGDSRRLSSVLIEHPWKSEYGCPINQVAMAAGYLSFSYVVIRSLEELGITLTPRQISGWLHCWNVLGYIMGVDEDLLLDRPETMEQADELYNIIWNRYSVTDKNSEDAKDGAALTGSLISWMENALPGWRYGIIKRMPRVVTRHLIGDEKADILGVKFGVIDGCLLGLLDNLSDLRARLGKEKNPQLKRIASRARKLSVSILFKALYQDRGKKGAIFKMPQHLERSWGVQQEQPKEKSGFGVVKIASIGVIGTAVLGFILLKFLRRK